MSANLHGAMLGEHIHRTRDVDNTDANKEIDEALNRVIRETFDLEDELAAAGLGDTLSPRWKAGDIAGKAAELVSGDRDRQHGQKKDNFQRIATMWNAYFQIRRNPETALDAVEIGHMMALMKIARTQSGDLNIDDYVDGCGYIACAGEIASGK